MSDNATWFIYILTNKPRGVIYIGSTNNLSFRIWQHRNRIRSFFPAKYGLDRLVWFDAVGGDMLVARHREWLMKRWRRDWKIELVETTNPNWHDLSADILGN